MHEKVRDKWSHYFQDNNFCAKIFKPTWGVRRRKPIKPHQFQQKLTALCFQQQEMLHKEKMWGNAFCDPSAYNSLLQHSVTGGAGGGQGHPCWAHGTTHTFLEADRLCCFGLFLILKDCTLFRDESLFTYYCIEFVGLFRSDTWRNQTKISL